MVPEWNRMEVIMPTVTLKKIPDELYEALKLRAKLHRRSLESEIITVLEHVIMPQPVDVDTILAEAQQIREKTQGYFLNDELLRRMKDEGRP